MLTYLNKQLNYVEPNENKIKLKYDKIKQNKTRRRTEKEEKRKGKRKRKGKKGKQEVFSYILFSVVHIILMFVRFHGVVGYHITLT